MLPNAILFFGTAGLTFLIARSIRVSWTLFVFVLPGTIAHELSHYVMALLTLSSPSPISLFPRRVPTGWILGSVSFKAGWFSGGVVALAPLYLLPCCTWGLYGYSQHSSPSIAAVCGYVGALCLQGALPSRQDWVLALLHPLGLILIGGCVYSYLQF